MDRAAHLSQRILTVGLTLCLVLCCCQVHFLTHGLQDSLSSETSPDFAEACCAGCVDEESSQDSRDHSDDSPDGCVSCCIKGDGLKDSTPPLPDADLVVDTIAFVEVAPVQPQLRHLALRGDLEAALAEPETLVRLHCALLV